MKKYLQVLILMLSILPVFANADVIQLDAGAYSTLPGYETIFQSFSNISLDHSRYYIWGLNDLSHGVDHVNIIFHDISNWLPQSVEDNWLSVYLFDNTPLGRQVLTDGESTTLPNWSSINLLGTWTDIDGLATDNDVVFTTNNSILLSYLHNGGTFGFGVDPDCHFEATRITIDGAAPVPEPATMFLLGTGLLGFAGLRKKFRK